MLSTRFLHPYHADPHDYFRFTNEGLAYLFREFSDVSIKPLGNRVHAAWMMMPGRWPPVTWVVSLLTPLVASIDIPGSPNPCGYLVRAVK